MASQKGPVVRQKCIGKGYDGFHHFAPISALPQHRDWMKGLMSQKTFFSHAPSVI